MCVYQSRSGNFDCYAGANGDVLDTSFGLCEVMNAVGGRQLPVFIQLV